MSSDFFTQLPCRNLTLHGTVLARSKTMKAKADAVARFANVAAGHSTAPTDTIADLPKLIDRRQSSESRASLQSDRNGDNHLPAPTQVPGRILAIHGSVIDAGFRGGEVPGLHEALTIADHGRTLVLEVEELLDAKKVRAVALGPTEGLVRGLAIERTGGVI